MLDVNNFDQLRIGLASATDIRSWSHVKLRNLKPLTTEH